MLLSKQSSGSRWRIRPDGPDKVTGNLTYLTDMRADHMLHGRILRSLHPHARIMSIRTDRAWQLLGVHTVLTHEDIPGLNGYGIAQPNQPVFCTDTVRYVGDAIAAVAAETPELAEQALALIEVEYELLPVVDDPEQALQEHAPLLHPDGNVLHRNGYQKGDIESGFAACTCIVENIYTTPRQMHTYMETEGGLFVPEPDGRLTVYSPTQHGLLDRFQLARILAVPEERIRVKSSPIGGSFGGKDELNVQPYGSLLAMYTKRPIKIHQSRMESVRAGLKRHPMKISMKTGADASGRILAHQVQVIADTGAYATLGAEVLNFALEHVVGPYAYEHIDVQGISVYTNNGMSGEFRGFGGNQTIFALESQLDRLAAALKLDPWELRRRNMQAACDIGPFGQDIAVTNNAEEVWQAVVDSPLWKARVDDAKSDAKAPWLKRGVGAAFAMHGAGLGYGMPDQAGGRLVLAADGKIEAVFGYEEMGQGLLAALEQMLIEQFECAASDLRLVIGDTDIVPDSGSTTASRATSMMWKSLQRMKPVFEEAILTRAGRILKCSVKLLRMGAGGIWRAAGGEANAAGVLLSYASLAEAGELISCETSFRYPQTTLNRIGAHYMYTYSAVVVKVEVNELTGRVKLLNQYHAVAAGPIINPQGYLGQIEGGSGMALGFTILEDAVMEKGQYMTRNLDTYLIPTIAEMDGQVDVLPIEKLPEGDPHGPRGLGEVGSVTLAPAIVSAIYEATGKWVSSLPIHPEWLQEAPVFLLEAVNEHA